MTDDMTCKEFAELLKTRDAHYPLSDRYVEDVHDSPDKSGDDEREHMIIWFEGERQNGHGPLLPQHPQHERAPLLRALGKRRVAAVDCGSGGRADRDGPARLRRRRGGGQLPPRLRRDSRDYPLERGLLTGEGADAVSARGKRGQSRQKQNPRRQARIRANLARTSTFGTPTTRGEEQVALWQ